MMFHGLTYFGISLESFLRMAEISAIAIPIAVIIIIIIKALNHMSNKDKV